MLYVGLTEDHRESATMFANVVGAQVISQLRSRSTGAETDAAKKTSGWYLFEFLYLLLINMIFDPTVPITFCTKS